MKILIDKNRNWWRKVGAMHIRLKKITFKKDVELENKNNGCNFNRKN